MRIAEAFVDIRVRSDKAKAEARDQARSTAQEVTRTFAQYFTAAVVVGELRKMTDAASNLEQAVGGTEAIFGKARVTIDRYATESARSLGLSERAFREVTSRIGGLLTGLDFTQAEAAETSVKLAQVGADLAAAFGGRPEEAVEALGAALRGEFDPLERFGVSLRVSTINLKAVELGLAESTSKVNDNARAQAALALIQEQTANVQGQFAREAETAAGKSARLTAQLENQRAEIGEAMLPVYGALLDSLGKVLTVFGELPAPVQTGVVAMLGIAAVAGPVRNTVQAFGGLREILTKIPPQAAAAAVAVGVAYVAWQKLTAESRELRARTDEVSGALISGRQRLYDYATAAAATEDEVDDLAVAQKALSDALFEGDDGDKIIQALGELGFRAEDAADILLDLQTRGEAALADLARGAGISADKADELAAALDSTDDTMTVTARSIAILGEGSAGLGLALEELQDQAEKVDLTETVQRELNDIVATAPDVIAALVTEAEEITGLSRSGEGAVEVYRVFGQLLTENADVLDTEATPAVVEYAAGLTATNTATGYVITSTGRLRDEYDEATDAASALAQAIDEVFGTYLDLDEATDQLTEHTEDLRATLEENGATLDQMTEKGRANRAAVRGQVEAIFDYAEASLRAGDSTDTVATKVGILTEQLRENMLQAGFTEEEVDAYLATLNLTPDSITTAIELTNDEIAKTKVQEHLDSLEGLPDEIETAIQAMIDEGAYAAAQARINALASARTVQLAPSITNPSYTSPSGTTFSSTGRFVAGGSNLLTYVGEVAGRSGDEVILPLGSSQRSRLAELISDPRVAGPLADVMAPVAAGGGSSITFAPVMYGVEDRYVRQMMDRMEQIARGMR